MKIESLKNKTALFSVSDKSEIEDFARDLITKGFTIIATKGTAEYLKHCKIKCHSIKEITGFSDLFDGRVKTLHPKLMGGILADRDKEEHLSEAARNDIPLIDIVVINLYPFEETITKSDTDEATAIENIDIGGITLLRAAAKNFHSVYVITDPRDYQLVIKDLDEENDSNTKTLRRKLAQKAFTLSAYYDSIIADYFQSKNEAPKEFPSIIPGGFRKIKDIRYGENPHQKASLYERSYYRGVSIPKSVIHSGRELSYNNINDLDAVIGMLLDFDEPFAVVVKHTTPCGAATAQSLRVAYEDALASDEMSAFGGIVGLNRKVDFQTAETIHKTFFLECIIAPGYEPEALNLLMKKKNRRIISCGDLKTYDYESLWQQKSIAGGILLQDRDSFSINGFKFDIVTETAPSEKQLHSLSFAMKIVKHIKSNAVVIVDGTKTVGIGGGQTSRVDASLIAIRKAGDKIRGAVAASDAFFPMSDGLEVLAKAGIKAVVQPGGSKRDSEVIEVANRYGIAMVFCGERHFRH